jgi:hypothetical protein
MPILPQIAPSGQLSVPGVPQVPQGTGLAEAGQAIGGALLTVGQGIQRQQLSSSLALGQADLFTRANDLKISLANEQNGAAYRAKMSAGLAQIQKNVLSEHRDVAPELLPQLTTHVAQMNIEAAAEGMGRDHTNAVNGLKLARIQYSQLAAQQPDKAPYFIDQYKSQLKTAVANHTLLASEAALEEQAFRTGVQYNSLASLIAVSPTRATTALSAPDFATKYPDVTPEQRVKLLAQVDTAMLIPERHATNQYDQMEGTLLERGLKAWKNGTLTPALAQQMSDAGVPSDKIKHLLPGFEPAIHTNPDVKNNIERVLRDSPWELNSDDIHEHVRDKTLSPADADHYVAEMRRAQEFAKTSVFQAAKHLELPLLAIINPKRRHMADARLAEWEQKDREVRAAWDAAVRDKHEVHDVYKLWDDFQKTYAGDKPLQPIPTPPRPDPWESKAGYATRLINMGYSEAELNELADRGALLNPEKAPKPVKPPGPTPAATPSPKPRPTPRSMGAP